MADLEALTGDLMMPEIGSGATISDLPDDCVLGITSYLSKAEDILCLQATCRRLRVLTRSSPTWPATLQRDFGLSVKV